MLATAYSCCGGTRRKALRIVTEVDAHVAALVPLAVLGVLDGDVALLAGDRVVVLAYVDVVFDLEDRERLAAVVGRAAVLAAARDQLVRAVREQVVFVDHPADARD